MTNYTLANIDIAVKTLLKHRSEADVWLFEGEMGAGKTTLIKALCLVLGVNDHVQSPTFALVNEYLSQTSERIYHFDFYRIKNKIEALDMGIDEYFYSGDLCLVEWPSKIEGLFPEKYLKITIKKISEDERTLEIELCEE
jgi:tRNA threonylcarbamoyladenosine biosynthesis protein TsaE